MTKDEDFKLLKIQTCVLRVNIHCDGCKQKVKKILLTIEGVYQVKIEAENQKVSVSGSIDSATLIKKLVRGGKHAELWSQRSSNPNNQKQKNEDDNKNNHKVQNPKGVKNLESLKNKHNFPLMSEQDHCYEEDDDEFDGEEEEMQLLRLQAMLKQQAAEANAKKAMANNSNANIITASAKNQMCEGRRGNDISSMMNLAGFHASGGAGNGNGGLATGITPMMNGYQQLNNHPAMVMRQQPQMMYNLSTLLPPTTGYNYMSYGPVPVPPVPYSFADSAHNSAAHMFSDDNTGSCSIM